ncbi:AraC family transcriptional regulator [Teredinibacter turnerae]|uniref:AraC family transcriptional regulator n=1 Tax=Teredinibacter turnerae TaxID=2426 RepID=UPI00037A71C2|nr:AraC family transcriptional regulator [Teredinibacter turnerae]
MEDDHSDTRALAPLQAAMAQTIQQRLAQTVDWVTPIPNLLFFRRDAPTEPDFCLIEPSVVLVVQGTKQLLIGDQALPYDRSNFLITSLDLPASSQVIAASSELPCLGVVLKLDIRMLAEIIAQTDLPHLRERTNGQSVGLGTMSTAIIRPFERLLGLLDEPKAINVLAPLIEREIHYRLLLSNQAALLRQITAIDSQGYRIARAIDWLKTHYTHQLRVEDLATRVQMSTPSFHHHFRQLTSMSPLQYQKRLRLHEAKRLMLNNQLDASSAAYQVGYESPSQFSREYSRMFGAPPKKDIEKIRRQALEE